MRLAANLVIDRPAVNQAETLGLSKLTASIIPQNFDFSWPAPLHPFDQKRARLKQIIQSTSAAFGNAARRLDGFVASGGLFTYGTYPDIEDLVQRQAMEMDRGRREKLLHQTQQLIHEKVTPRAYAPPSP